MKKKLLLSSIVSTLIFMSGCQVNSNDNNDNNENTETKQVQFVDSKVINIDYFCDNGLKGSSDNDGFITIDNGCNIVTLKIGGVTVGDFNASSLNTTKVTPSNLLELDMNNTNDPRLQNIIQFLQSIDNDQDPYNGIYISDEIKNKLKNVNLNLEDSNVTENDLKAILDSIGISILDRNETLSRYEETLRNDFNVNVDTVPPAKPIIKNIPSNVDVNNSISILLEGESGSEVLIDNNETGIIVPSSHELNLTIPLPSLTNRPNNDYNYSVNIQLKDTSGKISDVSNIEIPLHGKNYYDSLDVESVLDLLQNSNSEDTINYTIKYNTGNPIKIDYTFPSEYPTENIEQNATVTLKIQKGLISKEFNLTVPLPSLTDRENDDYNYSAKSIQLLDSNGNIIDVVNIEIPLHGKNYYDSLDVENVLNLLQNSDDPRNISYVPQYNTGNALQLTYDPPYPYPPTAIDQNYTVTVTIKKGEIEDTFQFNEFVPSNNIKITLNDGTISLLNNQYADEFTMTNGGVFVKKDDPDNFIGTSFIVDTQNNTDLNSADKILDYIANTLNNTGDYQISQVTKKVISPNQIISRYELKPKNNSKNLYEMLQDLVYNAFGYNINYDTNISNYSDLNDSYLDIYVEYSDNNKSYILMTLTNKDKDYTSEIEKIVNPDTLVQPNEKIVNEEEHFVFTNDHYKGDYLFVIDDSGSMEDEQESVKQAIERTFARAVQKYGLDWKATVIGTERTWDYSRWLNDPVENNITKLVEELNWLTTDGGDEVGMKLAYDYLTEGKITVRPGSSLTIIYASDEPEHATLADINLTTDDLSQSYFVKHHIKYDVILPQKLQTPDNLAYRMALATHGDVVNMYNYDTGYDEMANNAVREAAAKNSSIKLKYPAIASSINVMINGQNISGWEYVPTEQAIIFPQNVKPNNGDNITVYYSHLDFEKILDDAIDAFNQLPDDEKRNFTYPNVEITFNPERRLTIYDTNDSSYEVNATFKIGDYIEKTVTYYETPVKLGIISQNNWVETDTNTFESINHSDDSTSVLELKFGEDATVQYSVSSESGYDYLSIYDENNTQLVDISGEESGELNVTAGQVLRFEYSKDGSNSVGEDKAVIKIIMP